MSIDPLLEEEQGQIEDDLLYKSSRHVRCHLCKSENLIHGYTLAKADAASLYGGPGQSPQYDGPAWAMYYCVECDTHFPYPKPYPTGRKLQIVYQQILAWCLTIARDKRSFRDTIEKAVSIIKANKEMPGLPGGLEDDATLEDILRPLADRIQKLEGEVKRRKGGRPKGSRNRPKPVL